MRSQPRQWGGRVAPLPMRDTVHHDRCGSRVMQATLPCTPNNDTWVGCSANTSCNPHVPPVTTTRGGKPQPPSAPNNDNGNARVGRCPIDDDKDTPHKTPIMTA